MKKILLLLIISCFSLSAFPKGPTPAASPRVDQMIADWERAKAYTKEYLDAASEEAVNFKPSPEMRSFAEQMLHLAMGSQGIVATSTGKDILFKANIEKMEQYKNKEALTKVVMESYDFVIGILKTLDDQKLDEPVKFFNGQTYTRGTGISKAFEHQTHHRGQTTVYLRLKGITPPGEKLF
ncbi:MAG: DinB family protein [Cyclobacteriaceae bacterium]|nr:DinB family protein [Cyclobacteriaceae bacterium]